MQAQYVDKDCCISFKWHENQQGKLECINGNLTYEFIPNESFWKIVIRNNSSETAQVNWNNAQFIINGRASGLLLYPGIRIFSRKRDNKLVIVKLVKPVRQVF